MLLKGDDMEKRLEYNSKDSSIAFLMSILSPLLISSIIAMILKLIFSDMSNTTYYYLALAINQIVFFGCFFVYNKIKNVNIKSACKIKFNLNIWQILIIIVIGLIAMYGFSGLVDYLGYILKQFGYVSDSFSYLDLSNAGMFALSVIIVAVLPAICEESLFRGIALNGLKEKGEWKAIVISGLMFCIMHLSIEQSIYQFVLGMVLASVVVITGSLLSSVILHFFNNFYILLLSFVGFGGEASSVAYVTVFDHILPFLIAIISIVLIYLLLILLKKCTKNCESKIFSFKNWSKNCKNSNIDNVSQQNSSLDEKHNIIIEKSNSSQDLVNKEQDIKTKQSNNLLLILSLIFGALLWLCMVITNF